MDYRIDYRDGDAPITVLAQPDRARALEEARRLTRKADRIVYVIGAQGGADVGQIVYSGGCQFDRDGVAI
jgi:hypothetical protein